MRSAYRVVWSEGLMMMPQHLQQTDGYHERRSWAATSANNAYAWGVASLEFDPAALKAGQVRILSLVGVLPDGTPIAFDAESPESPPARPVEEHFGPTQRSVDVLLALPLEREGNANVAGLPSTPDSSTPTRYRAASRPVIDLATPQVPTPVAFAHPNFSIRFGQEVLENFETLKVGELLRDANGNLAWNEAFIPACLRVGASAWLGKRLRQLLALLVAKQRELSQRRRQLDTNSIEFGPSDVALGLQLLAINQSLPVVQHLVDCPDMPPLQAYLSLAQLGGMLCTFSAEADPCTLPKFQYSNLRATFEPLFESLDAMLGAVARAAFVTVKLEPRSDGLFLGALQDERLADCAQFVLAVRSELPEQQVADAVPKLCRVASWSEIHGLFQAAAPGLPLHLTHRPPSEIPQRPGVVYFVLPTNDRYWQAIATERNIAVFLPPPFEPTSTQVDLLAVPGEQRRTGGSSGSRRLAGGHSRG